MTRRTPTPDSEKTPQSDTPPIPEASKKRHTFLTIREFNIAVAGIAGPALLTALVAFGMNKAVTEGRYQLQQGTDTVTSDTHALNVAGSFLSSHTQLSNMANEGLADDQQTEANLDNNLQDDVGGRGVLDVLVGAGSTALAGFTLVKVNDMRRERIKNSVASVRQ